ncbi:hypothetical protein LDY98_28460, partial [Pseudomonas aeruginosa]|nr:hypothetical protein [Pseudomonas aeruginosa]
NDLPRIVFLPELTQVQLNNLLQVIFYCMAMQSAAVVVGPEQAWPPRSPRAPAWAWRSARA